MSQDKKNTAAEAVAVLQSNFDAAEIKVKELPETATPEAIIAAQKELSDAKEALEEALNPIEKPNGKEQKEKLVKGKFLLSPTGRYGLGYNEGEKASLPELQALELEEAGYFRIGK
jgi:NADH dehydrogenase/NADH:ubiquinone oxidoreductase subunit G